MSAAFAVLVTGLGYLTLTTTLAVLVLVIADAFTRRHPCTHEDETVERVWGCLCYRCLDCQKVRELGPVYPSHYCHQHPRRSA